MRGAVRDAPWHEVTFATDYAANLRLGPLVVGGVFHQTSMGGESPTWSDVVGGRDRRRTGQHGVRHTWEGVTIAVERKAKGRFPLATST